ncbi:MAG: STAS domain-containing protein [Rhodospirillales bacterium]|jgi:anti-sigma B factor antagonist|nr:STAS domain-containing protein [Rhodospirillales bacterium]
MEHSIREETTAVVVAFEGDVDLESSRRAREVLLECVGRKWAVLVDLSQVTYIDSSGVAALVESFQSARKGGTTFALAAVSDATLKVLQLARLDKVFTIFASVDDGLAEAG